MKFIRVIKSSLLNENSLGEPIANNEQTLQNFWNWFSDSKMVDEKGRPIVFYHGTKKKFDIFDKRKRLFNQQVFFFAPLKRRDSLAGYYAYDLPGKGYILSCYLKIENPMVYSPSYFPVTMDKNLHNFCDGLISVADKKTKYNYYNYSKDKLELEQLNVGDIIEVGVFEPNQIKHVKSKVFDKNTNNIYGSIK